MSEYDIYQHNIGSLNNKIGENLSNAFQPVKGLHESKIMFLFMEYMDRYMNV